MVRSSSIWRAGSISRVTATAPAACPPLAPLRTSLIDIRCCSTPPVTRPRGGSQEYSEREPGLDAAQMRCANR